MGLRGEELDPSLSGLFLGAPGSRVTPRDLHLRKTIEGSTSEIERGVGRRGKRSNVEGQIIRCSEEKKESEQVLQVDPCEKKQTAGYVCCVLEGKGKRSENSLSLCFSTGALVSVLKIFA